MQASKEERFSAKKTRHEYNSFLRNRGDSYSAVAQATQREQTSDQILVPTHVTGNPTRLDALPNGNESEKGLCGKLAERFVIEETLATGSESEVMIVSEKATQARFVLKLFRSGIAPDLTVMDRIRNAGNEHIVEIYEDGFENNRHYELLAYSEHGTLRHLLDTAPLQSANIRLRILKEISDAIDFIHSPNVGVIHRDIKPENLLISRAEPLNLVLIDFGISSPVSQSGEQAAKNFTLRYAAPECLDGVISKKSDYWSLGMVTIEVLNGEHPFSGLEDKYIEQSLRGGQWPPQDIELPDNHWRQLCLGLLNWQPKQRWEVEQISKWIEDRETHADLAPVKIESDIPINQFILGGIGCDTALKLAKELARHWQEGLERFENGDVRSWVKNELNDVRLVALADKLAAEEIDPNLRLLRFIYGIDPALLPVWKHLLMDRVDFFILCQKAESGEVDAQALVEEIYDLAVFDELGCYRDDSTMLKIHKSWKRAVKDYESGWNDLKLHNGPVEAMPARPVYLAEIYRNIVFDENEHARIHDAVSEEYFAQIAPCLWLFALGHPVKNLSLARKLVLLTLANALEDRANQQLHMYYDTEENPWVSENAQELRHKGDDYPAISFSSMSTGIYFFYGDAAVLIGQKVRLSWNAGEATSVNITGIGHVEAEGESVVDIYNSTVFTLYAKGSNWKVSSRLPRITVNESELIKLAKLHRELPRIKNPVPLASETIKLQNTISLKSKQPELNKHAELTSKQVDIAGAGKLNAHQPSLNQHLELSDKSIRLHQVNTDSQHNGWKRSFATCFSQMSKTKNYFKNLGR